MRLASDESDVVKIADDVKVTLSDIAKSGWKITGLVNLFVRRMRNDLIDDPSYTGNPDDYWFVDLDATHKVRLLLADEDLSEKGDAWEPETISEK